MILNYHLYLRIQKIRMIQYFLKFQNFLNLHKLNRMNLKYQMIRHCLHYLMNRHYLLIQHYLLILLNQMIQNLHM